MVTDRIVATLDLPPDVAAAVDVHRDWIAEQVLATSIDSTAIDGVEPTATVVVSS